MKLSPTTDQRQLGEQLHRWLASRELARQSGDGEFNAQTWKAMGAALGILGAGLPVEVGGTGGTVRDGLIIAEELGRFIAASPFVETVMIGAGLLQRAGGFDPLLRAITDGDARLTLAWMEGNGGARPGWVETRAVLTRDGWGWGDSLPEPWRFAVPRTASYLFERAQSIYGGTNEVQRNIICRHLQRVHHQSH